MGGREEGGRALAFETWGASEALAAPPFQSYCRRAATGPKRSVRHLRPSQSRLSRPLHDGARARRRFARWLVTPQLIGRAVRPQYGREGGSVELETLSHDCDATRTRRSQAPRMNAPRLAVVLWLLSALGCGTVPETYRGSPTRAGIVAGWRVDLNDRPGQELHLRNNTKNVVDITRIMFRECINVSGCVELNPGITLRPGEERFVTIMEPNDPTRPFSFSWGWRYSVHHRQVGRLSSDSLAA